MNRAVKGILATYGVEETINTLVWLASDGMRHPDRPEYEKAKKAMNEINNDIELLAYFMECHGAIDPNTGRLAKMLDDEPWRFDSDEERFEKEASCLRIEKLEWVEE